MKLVAGTYLLSEQSFDMSVGVTNVLITVANPTAPDFAVKFIVTSTGALKCRCGGLCELRVCAGRAACVVVVIGRGLACVCATMAMRLHHHQRSHSPLLSGLFARSGGTSSVSFSGGTPSGRILFDGASQATRTDPVFQSGVSCVLSLFRVTFSNIVTEARTTPSCSVVRCVFACSLVVVITAVVVRIIFA